jgi:hypothetical protein
MPVETTFCPEPYFSRLRKTLLFLLKYLILRGFSLDNGWPEAYNGAKRLYINHLYFRRGDLDV